MRYFKISSPLLIPEIISSIPLKKSQCHFCENMTFVWLKLELLHLGLSSGLTLYLYMSNNLCRRQLYMNSLIGTYTQKSYIETVNDCDSYSLGESIIAEAKEQYNDVIFKTKLSSISKESYPPRHFHISRAFRFFQDHS